jgi:hypothetical protein
MILFHYTSMTALIGSAGQEAPTTPIDPEINLFDFAAPGSILVDGLQPGRGDGDFDGYLARALPPCVWLTDDPHMPRIFCSDGDFRVQVVIPSTDRRLASWPRYVRKYAPDDRRKNFRNTVREVPGAGAAVPRFWIYFGVIPVERIKAVERVESDEQAPARK